MEPSIFKGIADNPNLLKALRELLEKQFDLNELSCDASDTVLGQSVRANLVGMQGITNAFREIERYKSNPVEKTDTNPAR